MKYNFTFLFFIYLLLACGGDSAIHSSESSVDTPEPGLSEEVSESKICYIAALTGMNLREEPSTRGAVLKLLPYNTACEIIGQSGKMETIDGLMGEWIEIKTEDQEGFIFSGYTLPIPLPGRNPSTDLKGYFAEHLIRMGNEETSRMTYDPKTQSYIKSKIPEEQLIVETESDKFEKLQEYAGGYYLVQEIGYEYQAQIGFLPGISLQEGFLLTRAIYPNWGYEGCKLNLGKLDLPTDDDLISVHEQCNFQVKMTSKDGKIIKISFLNDELGYYGLEITDTGNGIEIKDYFAL